jgi:hypothetical protein
VPRRSKPLANAAGIAATAALLELVAHCLELSDSLSFRLPTGYEAADALDVLGASVVVAAFSVALGGFLRSSHAARRRMLALSAGLFAVYGLSFLVSYLIRATEPGGPMWESTASQASGASAGALLLVAAGLLRPALLRVGANRLLGWACAVLSAHFALLAAAYGFALAAYLEPDFFRAPEGVIHGTGIAAGGRAVTAGAALVAAAAFFAADMRHRRGEPWAIRREQSLAAGALVFALGFLSTAAGTMIYASSGFGRTQDWLQGLWELGLAVAAAEGAIGFLRAGRAPAPI